jgi:orotidine-5'-phosphate decarboxylase
MAKQLGQPKPLIIGVTILTSMNSKTLREALNVHESLEDYVVHLAKLAKDSGLDGVVCSAQEATRIQQACGKDFVLVTPGIRPTGSNLNDQSRVLTPSQALAAGAHYLVVGRPITQASDPVVAAQGVLEEMNNLIRL